MMHLPIPCARRVRRPSHGSSITRNLLRTEAPRSHGRFAAWLQRGQNKHFLLSLLMLGLFPLVAHSQEVPSATAEARVTVSNPTPFMKETFTITLEITSRDIEIDSRLDLANLPEKDVMQLLGSFEALAVQRERTDTEEITRRRYRAQARLLQPGKVTLRPVLQLTSRRRVRSFFGSTVEVRPLTLRVPAITLEAKPLPDPPDGFSGIIGDFSIDIEATPLEIHPGDLVTVTTMVRGEGWIKEDMIPAMPAMPLLRAYRLRSANAEGVARRHTFNQTVVPMEEALQELPPITFVWFNTKAGAYQHDVFGPFPLTYKETPTEVDSPAAQTESIAPSPGLFTRRNVTLPDQTRAHVAPATTSKSSFTIAPTETIRILRTHEDWLLIEHNNNRGWIPSSALIAP